MPVHIRKYESHCKTFIMFRRRYKVALKEYTQSTGFSWGRPPAIFADHWTTNDLKVTGHKSLIIIYFFLSEIIFREKMVSLSNNNRFDNDNTFLCNIWHFSVIRRINYVYFFCIYLKNTWKNFVVNIWKYVIATARCRVQYNLNACHKHYKHFEWKRLRVVNNKNDLNGKECASWTLPRF